MFAAARLWSLVLLPSVVSASSMLTVTLEIILAQKRSEMIKERNWDCPTGMQACNIVGVANSWEVGIQAYRKAMAGIRRVIIVPMVTPPSPQVSSKFWSCLLQ